MPLIFGDDRLDLGQFPDLISPWFRVVTPQSFAKAFRERRTYGPYLRRLLAIQADAGRTAREMMICRSVVGRVKAPTFRKRLNALLGEGKG